MHRLHITALAAAATLLGCSGGGPALDPLDDQVVAVGEPLVLELRASSASGGTIRYDFSSNAPDASGATISQRPDGTGLFTWTPTARDVGRWVFDFSAADSAGSTTESISIDVRSAVGANSVPLFRRPLGAGTALQLEEGGCTEITLLVTDQDSTEVRFSEEEPRIEGAMLFQESGFEAIWRWCPTPAQRKAQDRYLLTLAADDGENPKALKRYQIILREPRERVCGGDAPVVVHTAEPQETRGPIRVTAQVTDDSGLKAAPLVYYSDTPPSDPPDLASMVQLNMELAEGDTRSGTWTVDLPNPLADAGPDTRKQLHYVIVAEDNDDSGGKCDHIAYEIYQAEIVAPGGDGGLGMCEPCTADLQCGGADDLCLRVGVAGEAFCFQSCTGDADCPDGSICSGQELESVDGQRGRQCVPLDERCDGGSSCPDDSFEQNDGRGQAQEIQTGTTDSLRMCPVGGVQADDDWYQFTVTGDTRVQLAIAGDTYPNMELSLLDETGELIAASEDWGSTDDVERCLKPGTYQVRVYSYFTGENDYSLTLSTAPADCRDTGGTCEDDAFEDDDSAEQARVPDFEDQVFRSSENQICSGDDDYFFITLFAGETIHATLAFDQVAVDQDLDLVVYDSSGALVLGCTEDDPYECDPYNGQSGDSGETLEFTAPAFDEYYVVARGWAGSENQYDVCIALEPGLCVLE